MWSTILLCRACGQHAGGTGPIKAHHHHSRVHPRHRAERARRRSTRTWHGVLMSVIALVLLIWLTLNLALVVFRWARLDRGDVVPQPETGIASTVEAQ